MRRFFVLGLLFLLMLALQYLQVGTDTVFNPLSLATFGFILLAAYTLGETASRLGLPKITGYIVTGLLFGPHVINLFSVSVVSDLRVINGLAIGMIALSAGGEMKVSSLRQIAKSLTLIVIVKGLLILLAITIAVYFLQPMLPFLAGASAPLVLAVGSIFGVLAIGTSPAATIAVINETGSKGRLADTTLGVAVFKDVVMVVLLAVAIALTHVFSSPEGTFDALVLLHVGEELGLSILAGAVLGVVIIAYIRYVHAEMWLFIIGIIFAMTAVAEFFHLEALLLFIVAGFVVQNFSRHGDHFVHLIESVALPVYVVFFSVAGAGLDLGALAQVGLVAVVLVVVRLAAIFAGTRLATRLAGEPEGIRKNAWLAFVSQAGVVIGLTIIIENNLPDLGPDIRTVVLGVVAINLIVGPILFKLALARVGETQDARGTTPAPDAAPEAEAPEAPPLPELPERIAFPEPAFAAAKLNAAAQSLVARLVPLRQDFEDEVLARQTGVLEDELARLRTRYDTAMDAVERAVARHADDPAAQARILREQRIALAKWLQSEAVTFAHRTDLAQGGRQAFETLFENVHAISQTVDEQAEVLLEPERLRPAPGDAVPVRAWKAVKRFAAGVRKLFGSGLPPMRTVPLRRIVRYHLDGLLPTYLVHVASRTAAQPLYALDKARILFAQIDDLLQSPSEGDPSVLDPDAVRRMRQTLDADFDQAAEDLRRYADEAAQRLALELVRTYEAILADFAVGGTMYLPARRRRFSRVNEASHRAHRAALRTFEVWAQVEVGTAAALAKHLDVVVLEDRVQAIVEDTILRVAQQIQHGVAAHVEAAHAACEQTHDHLHAAFEEESAPAALHETLAREQQALEATWQQQVLAPLQRLRDDRTLNALLDDMLRRFNALAAEVPETYELVEPSDLPAPDSGIVPGTVPLKTAPMREVARQFLETKVTRNLAEANRTLIREVDSTLRALYDVQQQVRFNLQAAGDELAQQTNGEADSPRQAAELALGGLERGLARLDKVREQVRQFEAQARSHIVRSTQDLLHSLEDEIARQSGLGGMLQREPQKALSRGASYLARLRDAARERYEVLRRWFNRRFRPFAQEVLREVRARRSLDELPPAERLRRYDQAALSPALVEHLPFIYQKLFALAPLDTDEFVVGREAEQETVQLAFQRWLGGTACSVAVVGEPGVGVSSFLHVLRRSLGGGYPVHALRFEYGVPTEEVLVRRLAGALGVPQLHTLAALTRYLQAGAVAGPEARRFVVVLEDVHYLYTRAPGGFELLRQLILLIAATGLQVFWVVAMNKHAWRYLDAVLGLADAFAFALELPPLDRDDLERAILERHRLSGLGLTFQPAPLTAQRRAYRRADEATRQATSWDEYFDQLHRVSGGNPLAALFYWLKSVEVHDEEVVIRPLERPSFGYVHSLDPVELLTLRVVLQQGSLGIDEHARLFGLPAATSQTTLMHLVQLNLLARHANGHAAAFTIHRPAYKPLADELAALHLL